ncbi:hypothetical protein P7D78_19340 [Enterococcus raffinosus]|uniref:Uncharacterized protein n=1 Tax=Enterococcus raffinosus TaxID=71452 RepID=A0AAW8T3P3_9ENTE|nr:hypothetical protein [Enterococcus raffinosus]MDT2540263.1 hypothetical protein [Enterococcus raffinosus]
MKTKMKSKWEQPKSRFSTKNKSNRKQSTQNNSAVRSLLMKLLSVFIIGFITKKLNNRKNK